MCVVYFQFQISKLLLNIHYVSGDVLKRPKGASSVAHALSKMSNLEGKQINKSDCTVVYTKEG